jgi:hypothetical protein
MPMNLNVTKRLQRKSRRQGVRYWRWTRALGQGLRLACFLPVRHASPIVPPLPFSCVAIPDLICLVFNTKPPPSRPRIGIPRLCKDSACGGRAYRPSTPSTSPDQFDATCPRRSIHTGTFGRAVPPFLGPRPWSSRAFLV